MKFGDNLAPLPIVFVTQFLIICVKGTAYYPPPDPPFKTTVWSLVGQGAIDGGGGGHCGDMG